MWTVWYFFLWSTFTMDVHVVPYCQHCPSSRYYLCSFSFHLIVHTWKERKWCVKLWHFLQGTWVSFCLSVCRTPPIEPDYRNWRNLIWRSACISTLFNIMAFTLQKMPHGLSLHVPNTSLASPQHRVKCCTFKLTGKISTVHDCNEIYRDKLIGCWEQLT